MSNSFLRVYPEHDLVVVMVRNAAGANYQKYLGEFVKAVAEGIER